MRIKNPHFTYTAIQGFFAKHVHEIGHRPYSPEYITISLLPETIQLNKYPPSLPYRSNMTDDYLEIRRSAFSQQHGNVFIALVFFIMGLFCLCMAFIFPEMSFSQEGSSPIFLFTIISVYFLPFTTWLCFLTPHDLPVRFNRKTRKVYVSNITVTGNFFFRKYKLTFHEMKWDDVQAWSLRRKSTRGTIYQGLHLLDNHSDQLEDFQQTCLYRIGAPWSNAEWTRRLNNIRHIWSYIQHYMDFQPVPDESKKPKQRIFLSNKWRFKWPDAVDKQSHHS